MCHNSHRSDFPVRKDMLLVLSQFDCNVLLAHDVGCHFASIWSFPLDIWLGVHHSITFLLLPTWYTNFLFIYANYNKLNSFIYFEGIPPTIRRSMTQIVHMQRLVSSLSAGGCLVQPLRKDFFVVAQDSHLKTVTIPEAAYVQFGSLTTWWWAECARKI
jgi:hypothetical protein